MVSTEEPAEFTHPYLTSEIIAYIGNKRRLLPLIHLAIRQCLGNGRVEGLAFLDLFAGSGAVSRLARFLGFRVCSNDWEPYSFVINRSYLGIGPARLGGMFRERGGIDEVLRYLNALPDPEPGDQYIARHYSPSTEGFEGFDHRRERLFYTRRNGLIIDRIRNAIDDLYPGETTGGDSPGRMEKDLLVALLLYEAATHTNTSGVFKAYHKGFGGHGGDALRRILAPIELKPPVLVDSQWGAEVFKEDANRLLLSEAFGNREFDIAYLDPPYNQHQYGSNYHLLNTIALWDKPEVSGGLNARGVLAAKAAIRKDWVNTRSAYCYRESAGRALRNLLEALRARSILLSYSTEGIIGFDELVEICSMKGRVDMVTSEYVKYRGGKQSIDRLNRNIEFVLIVDPKRTVSRSDILSLESLLLRRRLSVLFGKRYLLDKLRRHFTLDSKSGFITLGEVPLAIQTRDFFELVPPPGLERLGKRETLALIERLEGSMCADREEELAEIVRKLREGEGDPDTLVKLIPGTLRKFAHKKYRERYLFWVGEVKSLAAAAPERFAPIDEKMERLERIARKRFTE